MGAIVGPVIAFSVLLGVLVLFIWTKRRDKRRARKHEWRSSVTSSIFLPPELRRKYDRRSNGTYPYPLDLRTSFHPGARGSIASSNASTLCGEYSHWNVSGDDEKNVFPPSNATDVLTAPAVRTPDELHPSTTQPVHGSDEPTFPPPIAFPSGSRHSTSILPLEARAESNTPESSSAAQSRDSRQTVTIDSKRNSIDRPPPFPEDV